MPTIPRAPSRPSRPSGTGCSSRNPSAGPHHDAVVAEVHPDATCACSVGVRACPATPRSAAARRAQPRRADASMPHHRGAAQPEPAPWPTRSSRPRARKCRCRPAAARTCGARDPRASSSTMHEPDEPPMASPPTGWAHRRGVGSRCGPRRALHPRRDRRVTHRRPRREEHRHRIRRMPCHHRVHDRRDVVGSCRRDQTMAATNVRVVRRP